MPLTMSSEELLRNRLLGVLNKIPLQTEEDLTREFLELLFDEFKLNSKEDWAVVAEVIFQKAIEEQEFCETYSALCKAVVAKQLELSEKSSNISSFHGLLLSTCQHKFENIGLDEENAHKVQTKEILEKRNHDRRIMFGNIRFIGELYKQNILIPMIMHSCVMELFCRITAGFKNYKEAEEDPLECLCLLLSTVGEKLSKEKIGNFAHQFPRYFDQLQKIETSSSRIRFMILDLLDLKKNDWKPRRKQEEPEKQGDFDRGRKMKKSQMQHNEQKKTTAVLQAPSKEFRPPPVAQQGRTHVQKKVGLLRGPSVSAPEPSSQTEETLAAEVLLK